MESLARLDSALGHKKKVRLLLTRLKWGERTHDVLAKLKHHWPHARFGLITFRRLEDNLSAQPGIEWSVVLDDHFPLRSLPFHKNLLSSIRRTGYDAIIIPTKGNALSTDERSNGRGYEWVRLFSLRTTIRKVILCDSMMNFRVTSRSGVVRSTVRGGLGRAIADVSTLASNLSKARRYGIALKAALDRSITIRKPTIDAYPRFLTIEPTNKCNLRCVFCECGQNALRRPTGLMRFEDFKTALHKFPKGLAVLYLNSWGESLLHPEIYDMIEYARAWSNHITIDTNGNHMDPEAVVRSGLHHIVFSVDGLTQESYERLRRGGNLEKVINNIRSVAEWKKRMNSPHPRVTFKFIVMKHNEAQIGPAETLSRELGADEFTLSMFTARSTADQMIGFLPTEERYSRYVRSDMEKGIVRVKYKTHSNLCSWQWSGMTVYWDGSVYPCCKYPYNFGMGRPERVPYDYSFGNIFEADDCMAVWNSGRARAFRTALQERRAVHCQDCYMEDYHD